jgi:hypothetical protein
VEREHVTERSELGRLAVAAGAVVVIMAGVVLGVTLVVAPAAPIIVSPAEPSGTPVLTPETGSLLLPPSRPVSLEIPAIGVDAGPLVELDLTPDGAMEVPSEAGSLGWFAEGPAPGEAGTAIIAGHTDYGYLRGAFYRLHELGAGETVSVRRADGRTAVFLAYRRDTYPPDTRGSDLVVAASGTAELRLITCQGDYDGVTTGDTVVVSARLSRVEGS